MFILWKQILRAHIAPFLYGFAILMFVFLLQFIMRFLEQLAGKGLSSWLIAEFIVVNLAHMVVLAIPMAVLVATIMAYGGLSQSNEVTAMRSSGISLYKMMAPAFIVSILICFFLIFFFNDVLPDANHRAKVLTSDIYRKKPTISLVPGLFSDAVPGYSILVRKTFEKSNDLEDVSIFDHTRPKFARTITAKKGTVSFSPDYRRLIMDLSDGEIHEANIVDFKQYRKIHFETHRIAMPIEGVVFTRSELSSSGRSEREMSAHDLQLRVDSLTFEYNKFDTEIKKLYDANVKSVLTGDLTNVRPYSGQTPEINAVSQANLTASLNETNILQLDVLDKQIREYQVEIYKKYAVSVAAIVFFLLGAPLGIMSRKGTFGMAASLSLFFFVVYWVFLIGGEKLADRAVVSPAWGMWMANITIGSLAIYLTYRTARETLTIDLEVLKRFVPKRWRASLSEGEQR